MADHRATGHPHGSSASTGPSSEQQGSVEPVIDVTRLMEDVRARVAQKRAQGLYGDALPSLAYDDPSALVTPLDRLVARSPVAGRPGAMRSTRRFLGWPINLARRIALKLFSRYLDDVMDQVRAFNAEVVSAMRWLEEDRVKTAAGLAESVGSSEERLRSLEPRVDLLEPRVGPWEDRLLAFEPRVDSLEPRVDSLERRVGRADAIAAALEPLAVPESLRTSDDSGLPAIGFRGDASPAGGEVYREFQEQFRLAEDVIRERQRLYVPMVSDHAPVLDLGCGRGEFLDLLSEAGVAASGVDLDAGMVARCREKGHAVELGDANGHLDARPDGSLGALFSAQLIEHLDYGQLMRLMRLSYDKLEPGGLFIAETVNPLSLVAFRYFWLDPTHRTPVYPEVAVTLGRLHGFSPSLALFPDGSGDLETDRRESQDYALVATKPLTGSPRSAAPRG